MKITIDRVKVQNFANIKENELTFADGLNIICGRNGAGKSNVLNAIIWCLFGKNFEDKKKFEIIPLNPDQSQQKVNPEVTMTLTVDDRQYELKRQIKGSTTNCEIDGSPKKVGEYDTFVASIFQSEARFKMFTMPLYFPESLHWTQQRELLMQFFPEPAPSMVLGQWANETKQILWSNEFAAAMDKQSPSDYAAKHEKDLKECELKKSRLDAQIELLDQQLEGNHNFDALEYAAERDALRAKVAEHNDMIKLISEYNTKLAKNRQILLQQRLDTMAEIGKLKRMAEAQRAGELAALHRKLHDAEDLLIGHRQRYAELKRQEESTVCQACGQEIPAATIQAAREMRQENLDRLTKVGTETHQATLALKDAIEQTETAPLNVDSKELQAKADALEAKINSLPQPKEIPQLDPILHTRLEELEKALARSDVHEENIKRRDDLDAEERRINQDIQNHVNAIWTAGQYIYYRSKVVINEVNQQFKNISVRIFDVQKNGVTKETFEITADGVPYSDLNTAGKLQAGLELIGFLKEKLGIETTVFIDNGERYTDVDLAAIKGQVIITWARKGSPLKVEVA